MILKGKVDSLTEKIKVNQSKEFDWVFFERISYGSFQFFLFTQYKRKGYLR